MPGTGTTGGVGGAFTPVSPGAVTVIGFKLVPVKVTGVSAGLVEKVPVFEPVTLTVSDPAPLATIS